MKSSSFKEKLCVGGKEFSLNKFDIINNEIIIELTNDDDKQISYLIVNEFHIVNHQSKKQSWLRKLLNRIL